MTRDELLSLFEAMSSTLAHRGCEVRPFVVEPPASLQEIAQLERSLDLTLPTSFRSTLLSLSRAVDWSWRTDEDFPEPFSDIFSGELCWSVGTIEQENELHRGWVAECFPDPDDPYDSIWHGKLAFFSVGNGDQLAVELNGPLRGSVVYLSHDDGEGHGYVLADSLGDLVDRWTPLACPGAEDWQWLPFVPWDEGPIDPTSANASAWMELLDLSPDSVRIEPVRRSDDHIDALLDAYRRAPNSTSGERAGVRVIKCCSEARADDVLELLRSDRSSVQECAARRLGEWHLERAIPELVQVAQHGTPNGRMTAIIALVRMPGATARTAVEDLRSRLDDQWKAFLDSHRMPS